MTISQLNEVVRVVQELVPDKPPTGQLAWIQRVAADRYMTADNVLTYTDLGAWKYCDGTFLLISAWPALYSVIGDLYDDGTVPVGFFNLPPDIPPPAGLQEVFLHIFSK